MGGGGGGETDEWRLTERGEGWATGRRGEGRKGVCGGGGGGGAGGGGSKRRRGKD